MRFAAGVVGLCIFQRFIVPAPKVPEPPHVSKRKVHQPVEETPPAPLSPPASPTEIADPAEPTGPPAAPMDQVRKPRLLLGSTRRRC